MEKKFKGSWECPLNIPIDAPNESFPKEVWQAHLNRIKLEEENKQRQAVVINAFEELSMVLTGENLTRLEIIRTYFLPSTKKAERCENSTKQIGEVDQLCCGGTIKKVSAFDCRKHVLCTDKKCHSCNDFVAKKKES